MIFSRGTDQIIVFLSDMVPDYSQPIQIAGLSLRGIPAIDVALRLNQTHADARYAMNHVTFLDATTADARWIDPKSGNSTEAGSFINTGTQSFSTPEGWEDAILILESS